MSKCTEVPLVWVCICRRFVLVVDRTQSGTGILATVYHTGTWYLVTNDSTTGTIVRRLVLLVNSGMYPTRCSYRCCLISLSDCEMYFVRVFARKNVLPIYNIRPNILILGTIYIFFPPTISIGFYLFNNTILDSYTPIYICFTCIILRLIIILCLSFIYLIN